MTHGAGAATRANGCNPRGGTSGRGPTWAMIRPILGLSIREFSDETGINRGELSKIERGLSCPTPGQANAILSAWQRFRDPA
jgi:hypothetical protein